MPSRPASEVTPRATAVVFWLTAAFALIPLGSCYSTGVAIGYSRAVEDLPGAREFGDGEIWLYGRRMLRDVEGDGGDGWSSGVTCSGDAVYQRDILIDGWTSDDPHPHTGTGGVHITRGSPSQSHESPRIKRRAQHGDQRRHYYRSKKASRVELSRSAHHDFEERSRMRRGATAVESNLWPGAIIPYEIDAKCDEDTKNLVIRSMRHWEEHTCLRFIPRANQTSYVLFYFSGGCCSHVGRSGSRQKVYLGPGCNRFRTIIHEIGHVVGFWHEQSRPDRDEFVTVYEGNISPGDLSNFFRYDTAKINSLEQPYDYDSVMHYGQHSFSRNFRKTIIPKTEWASIGQQRGLSVGDILQANLLYRCTNVGTCGGTIFKSFGQITSPHYPEPFVPNTTCDWSISVGEGFALKLTFVDIDLEPDKDGQCPGDYIEVRDGLGELGRLIGRYCGGILPTPITLDSGRVWLRFRARTSPVFQSRAGFTAKFQSVSFDERLTVSSGVLKSKNYPDGFPSNTDSVWQITVEVGFMINLRIIELRIPVASETGCYGDYLNIIEGDTSQSPLITKLCHSQSNVGVVSAGESLRIELHSGNPERRGDVDQPTRFHAHYSQRDINECQRNSGDCEQACLNLIGSYVCGCQYGYVLAANYRNCIDIDECLDNNGGCSDICVNTEGAHYCTCSDGFLLAPDNATHCIDKNECDDWERNDCEQHCYNTIGEYACACKPGFILAPNGRNCVGIKNCGGEYGGYEGTFVSPEGPPINFNSTLDCVWRIQVDPAFTVSLRIKLLQWTNNDPCEDYIDFNEGQVPMGVHVQICNKDEAPHVFQTNSNTVWMHYRSVWPHGGAFQVEYFTRERENNNVECGGVLHAGSSGIIESPGYPFAYPNDVNCLWQITGQNIRLQFESFELEKEDRCSYDYLDIQDGDDNEPRARHIGRFCGNRIPPNEVTSSTGDIFIKFQSDASVREAGFRVMFEVN
ncbi:tolloid-like protein 2 [Asterias rubens]|uniref:tolloid-like protein 2 n=1 Tax=Asterias rubens TaxID=7604 RepID=UPI001455D1EA|nr:tolloid-like protein 2 [Asterias rubens]